MTKQGKHKLPLVQRAIAASVVNNEFVNCRKDLVHGEGLYDKRREEAKTAKPTSLHQRKDCSVKMGLEGLAEEDKYLMRISLDDLETASWEYQAYWLISVKAARRAFSSSRRQRAQTASRRSQNNHG